jgi:hypothetical protein
MLLARICPLRRANEFNNKIELQFDTVRVL